MLQFGSFFANSVRQHVKKKSYEELRSSITITPQETQSNLVKNIYLINNNSTLHDNLIVGEL